MPGRVEERNLREPLEGTTIDSAFNSRKIVVKSWNAPDQNSVIHVVKSKGQILPYAVVYFCDNNGVSGEKLHFPCI